LRKTEPTIINQPGSWALFACCLLSLLLSMTVKARLAWAWDTPAPAFVLRGDETEGGLLFNNPTDVAFGRDGDIFVTDTLNAIVQVFDRNGNFKFYLGEPGSRGGQFTIPWGIATDKNGKVYVTDIAQHRIHIFDHNGLFLGQFGGPGQGEGKFNLPFDIFINRWDVLNILDSGNGLIQRVKKGFEDQFGGIGKSDGSFDSPVAFVGDDAGRFYVADSGNMRIQILGSDGSFQGKFGMAGQSDGSFIRPQGIARDSGGRLYISDGDKNSVRISVFGFSERDRYEFLYKWGEIGTEAGNFLDIGRIAFDQEKRFYVVDIGNNRVQVFEDPDYSTAPCFYCHSRVEAKSAATSVHQPFKDKDCQSCHLRHTRTSTEFYVARGTELCAKCHDFKEDNFINKHEQYPVHLSECSGCHDPHGSVNEHLLRKHSQNREVEIPCNSCHDVLVDDTVRLKETRKRLCYICHNTKLGEAHYNVFNQGEKDCLECHVHHSGSQPANLKDFSGRICDTEACHSGSNLLHQHLSDILPAERMRVPASLPLDNQGRIMCLTCHAGHSTPNREYLRVAKENLCSLCHQKRLRASEAQLEIREVIEISAPPTAVVEPGEPQSQIPQLDSDQNNSAFEVGGEQ